MDPAAILDAIEEQTRTLVGLHLRSNAVVVARLYDLITEANQAGFTHKSIHARIVAGGMDITQGIYATYLHRAKATRARVAKGERNGNTTAGTTAVHAQNLKVADDIPAMTGETPESETAGSESATFVMDSLSAAKNTAKKDYGAIGRSLARNQRKTS